MIDHKPVGYSVKTPESFKKMRGKKVRYIILYALLFVFPIAAVLFMTLNAELVAYTAVFALAVSFFAFKLTWSKTKPEFDYTFEGGVFTLAVIYGGRTRRTLLELELADACLIAPKNGVYDGRVKDFAPEKTVQGAFDDAQSNYFVLYKDENDTPCIAYIYANEDAVKVMRQTCTKTYIR